MSLSNGDRSRAHINRKRRIKYRQQIAKLQQALHEKPQTPAAPAPAAPRKS
jgi:hypothetical protein